jgi:hypothetical protein
VDAHRHRLAPLVACVIVASGAAACSVVTPPPIVPAHARVVPPEPGTVTISLVVGVAEGAWTPGTFGGELRVEHQRDDDTAVGVALAGGVTRGRPSCGDDVAFMAAPRSRTRCEPLRWLVQIRAYAVETLDAEREHVAAVAGVGLGAAEGGLVYTTLSGGVRFATANDRFDVYAAPSLALSIPLRRGRAIDGLPILDPLGLPVRQPMTEFGLDDRPLPPPERPSPTFYVALDAGFVPAGDQDVVSSGAFGFAAGWSLDGPDVVLTSASAGLASRR